METNNLDLITLIQKVPTATVSLQLSDLNTFSRRLIAQTREEYECEITGRLEARNEVYLTSDTVKQTLKVGNTTLWRWAKAGMLVPVMVGGQKKPSYQNRIFLGGTRRKTSGSTCKTLPGARL